MAARARWTTKFTGKFTGKLTGKLTGGWRRLVAASALLACSGCGGPAFEVSGARAFTGAWPADNGQSMVDLRRHASRMREARPIVRAVDIAIGIPPGRQRLDAVLLDGSRRRWSVKVTAETVVLLEHVAVVLGDGWVMTLSLQTGKVLAQRRVGDVQLIGAGDDGDVTAVSLGYSGLGGSAMLAFDRKSQVVRQFESEATFGAPVVDYGIAYVPFDTHFLGAVDLDSGVELARIEVPFNTRGAFTRFGHLYAGDTDLLDVDSDLLAHPTRIAAPSGTFPAAPLSQLPESIVPRRTMRGWARPRLFASTRNNSMYHTTFFEAVNGYLPSGDLTFSVLMPGEVLAAEPEARGLMVCVDNGDIMRLTADGTTQHAETLGHRLVDCVMRREEVNAQAPTPPAFAFTSVLQSERQELAPLQEHLRKLVDAKGTKARGASATLPADNAAAP